MCMCIHYVYALSLLEKKNISMLLLSFIFHFAKNLGGCRGENKHILDKREQFELPISISMFQYLAINVQHCNSFSTFNSFNMCNVGFCVVLISFINHFCLLIDY